MSLELKYPLWQEPLRAAILEFDPLQLPAKVRIAEAAIEKRMDELGKDLNKPEELRALFDALSIIHKLRKDRLG